jgi:hypothetical protein
MRSDGSMHGIHEAFCPPVDAAEAQEKKCLGSP